MDFEQDTREAPGSPVPVIDIAPFFHGSPAARLDVAARVDAACRNIGFLVITGHGVPQAAIDAVYATTQEFYALPDAEKMKVASPVRDPFHAYAPITLGTPTMGNRLDLREMFHVNRYDTPEEAIAAGYPPDIGSSAPANLWPERPEGFVDAWRAYYTEMEALTSRMFHPVRGRARTRRALVRRQGRSLGVEPGRELLPRMQIVPPEPGQLRSHAHIDFASMTILYQDDAPGGSRSTSAVRAGARCPRFRGSFVVNLGDLMARWTNERWVATPHRVVNPPREFAMTRRISVPYFHLPNHDAVIAPIPTCVTPAHPARYAPVVAGEWACERRLGRPANYGRVSV